MTPLLELRCTGPRCNRLLARARVIGGLVEIKCPNCKTIAAFHLHGSTGLASVPSTAVA